jgi:hypothetical protein
MREGYGLAVSEPLGRPLVEGLAPRLFVGYTLHVWHIRLLGPPRNWWALSLLWWKDYGPANLSPPDGANPSWGAAASTTQGKVSCGSPFGRQFVAVQGYQPPQRARTLPMMSKSKIKYVSHVPTIMPAGRVVVHNRARHKSKTVPGTDGFRAWFTYHTTIT